MTEQSIPFGLRTITPYLVVDGVSDLIAFLQRVFGAVLRGAPKYRQDGSVEHAEVTIGDSVVMMGEPVGDLGPMPGMLYVYVADCDATYSQALAAGAVALREPENYPHGDRYGGVIDLTGNVWWIVTHVGLDGPGVSASAPQGHRARRNANSMRRTWPSLGPSIQANKESCPRR